MEAVISVCLSISPSEIFSKFNIRGTLFRLELNNTHKLMLQIFKNGFIVTILK